MITALLWHANELLAQNMHQLHIILGLFMLQQYALLFEAAQEPRRQHCLALAVFEGS
jgi:hypothetical protein